jgi:EAL domain-containing protein (putative c-di-GMP-specific phosphodiesterase class I)
MRILRDIGCHGAQGYLFSSPLELVYWEFLDHTEPYLLPEFYSNYHI